MSQRQQLLRVCLLLIIPGYVQAQPYLPPSPYLSFSDSPFAEGPFEYFHLEDFEDRLLNTPGVSVSGGGIGEVPPWPTVDSVDADDGVLDGNGNNGNSWYSYGVNSFTFSFEGSQLSGLPTHAGIVWTDVGASSPAAFFGQVSFEAHDALGELIPGVESPVLLGDASPYGETAEDRFFGVIYPGGISSITISMPESTDWEVDHLQYGRVPEPAAGWLLGVALAISMRRRICR